MSDTAPLEITLYECPWCGTLFKRPGPCRASRAVCDQAPETYPVPYTKDDGEDRLQRLLAGNDGQRERNNARLSSMLDSLYCALVAIHPDDRDEHGQDLFTWAAQFEAGGMSNHQHNTPT